MTEKKVFNNSVEEEFDFVMATTKSFGVDLYDTCFGRYVRDGIYKPEKPIAERWENINPCCGKWFLRDAVKNMLKELSVNMALYEKKRVRMKLTIEVLED